jgi:hypothetical protein
MHVDVEISQIPAKFYKIVVAPEYTHFTFLASTSLVITFFSVIPKTVLVGSYFLEYSSCLVYFWKNVTFLETTVDFRCLLTRLHL